MKGSHPTSLFSRCVRPFSLAGLFIAGTLQAETFNRHIDLTVYPYAGLAYAWNKAWKTGIGYTSSGISESMGPTMTFFNESVYYIYRKTRTTPPRNAFVFAHWSPADEEFMYLSFYAGADYAGARLIHDSPLGLNLLEGGEPERLPDYVYQHKDRYGAFGGLGAGFKYRVQSGSFRGLYAGFEIAAWVRTRPGSEFSFTYPAFFIERPTLRQYTEKFLLERGNYSRPGTLIKRMFLLGYQHPL
ncbi:MAG: hypothetical protein HS115_02310 [Spirochaetales bacterium]|nr:hypothetical protein [Spirochaetales bacterium]